MSKYKVGDKVVLTLSDVNEKAYYPYYMFNNNNSNLWISSTDKYSEPLSTYTEPLERKNENKQRQIEKLVDKLHRQAAEITRLLAENKELKAKYDVLKTSWDDYEEKVNDTCNTARAEGQNEAWELAKKCMLMTDRERETIFGSGHNALYGVLTYFDYKHAAAKVAEWERKKEEICVGDMLLSNGTSNKCVVTYIGCELITMLWDDGSCSNKPKNFIRERFKKIGHIDVASMLAQIGGEE